MSVDPAFLPGLLLGLALLAPAPASAQDALRGKRLYLDAARIVGSGVSCVDCHGGLPDGMFGIGRAAGDPARIATALETIPQMIPLRGRLTAADFADLAAYLGDPAVASPQVTVTTLRPDGEAGPADRIDFGAINLEAASEAAVLQIANTGQLPFVLTAAPALAGDHAGEFSMEVADCSAGAILAPLQSCRFELRFHPAGDAGMRSARFAAPHDWVGGGAAVALLGSAERPSPSSGCRIGEGGAAQLLVVLVWALRARRATRPGGPAAPERRAMARGAASAAGWRDRRRRG